MHLDAEGTADVAADHAHVGLLQAELARIEVGHHVRRLVRVVHHEAPAGGREVGQHGARLQRHAGVAAEAELVLDHHVGALEHRFHAAGVDLAVEAQVAAELGMDHRRGGIERGVHVHRRGQRLPFDLDRVERVLGQRAGAAEDGEHRLALPVARSIASACCGGERMPARCLSVPTQGAQTAASWRPSTMAAMPGMRRAASASMRTMRACACGLRR